MFKTAHKQEAIVIYNFINWDKKYKAVHTGIKKFELWEKQLTQSGLQLR